MQIHLLPSIQLTSRLGHRRTGQRPVVLALGLVLGMLGLPGTPRAQTAHLTNVQKVVAGFSHTCVLTRGGGVKCWGNNFGGQLGDNSTTDRSAPVDVAGLTSGATAVAAGWMHTCALTNDGGAKCWGDNSRGQLGDNSTTDRPTPVGVAGLASGVGAIAAGAYHTCTLTSGGGVKCWGRNHHGQLGDTSTTDRLAPVDVSGLTSGVVALSAGYGHTCALTNGGGVKCWGYNQHGQLGDNSATNRRAPVDVPGLASGVTILAAGLDHTCALINGGGVKCWGRNDYGQLGDNSTTTRRSPVDVAGLASDVAALAAGLEHTCALVNGGRVKCWGGNLDGQLGDNSTTPRFTPVHVSGLTSGVSAFATGWAHTCALTSGGGVKCWGYNGNGELGDNSTTSRLTPVDVAGLTGGAIAVSAGYGHTCALTSGGGAKCWGYNGYGQLGDNSTSNRHTPVDVAGLTSGATAVAAGYGHTCALVNGGGVKCWGYNKYGQLGDNSATTRLIPVDVSGLTSGVIALSAGYRHTCALVNGGGVKCWGYNEDGQLGDDSATTRRTPVGVAGLTSDVTALAAVWSHTCALTSGGGAKCWGYNGYGQLGDNSTSNRHTPVDVAGLASGVIGLSAGSRHTCALISGGGVKCWGDNYFGQLGDGTAGIRPFPAYVLVLRFTVWEFYNSTLRHYFMTASEAEAAGIDQGAAGPGWSRTGQSFYAFPPNSEVAGLSPVCRFYGTPGVGPNSHFYTANSGECEWVKTDPGWFYEGIAFRIAGTSGGSCASGGVPVYRVYNGRWRENDSNHRYLTDSSLYAQMQAQGWAGEGVVFCAAP